MNRKRSTVRMQCIMEDRAYILYSILYFSIFFFTVLESGRKLISILPRLGMALHEADNFEGVIIS